MRISANGVALEVEDHGSPSGEPLLLVMGLGMPLVGWPEEFVRLLAAKGFRVIAFDNRDCGLSQGFDHLGVPSLVMTSLRYAAGFRIKAPYTLDEMADDAAGVLDALDIRRAHVCGASMGGMIAQALAARHPARVKSLTLMMTTSGARHLPRPSAEVRRVLLARPKNPRDPHSVVAHLRRFFDVVGSPAYRPEPALLEERLLAMVRRAWQPAGTMRQLVAIAAHGDRTPALHRLALPAHIVHGSADPLVPVAAAHDLVAKIRGASLDAIDGMGHDLPLELLPRFAEGIAGAAAR